MNNLQRSNFITRVDRKKVVDIEINWTWTQAVFCGITLAAIACLVTVGMLLLE